MKMVTLWEEGYHGSSLRDLDKEALLAIRGDGTGVLLKFRYFQGRSFNWNSVSLVDTRRPGRVRVHRVRAGASLQSVLPPSIARAATTDGERRAATTQLNRILESMALYYLPSVDERLEIEAPRPGRGSGR